MFHENRLFIKSIKPIQKYLHTAESYACSLKILFVIVDPLMNFLISFGMCLTWSTKISYCVTV